MKTKSPALITGASGQVMLVERSTDLLYWLPLQTNTLGRHPLYFNEPNWWQSSSRLYGVRLH